MSKSEAIRQFFKDNPNATNAEVVEKLAAQGVAVSPNLVNQVRHDYKHKKGWDTPWEPPAHINDEDEPLLKVKRLADELGGLDCLIYQAFLLKKLFGNEEVKNNAAQECQPDRGAEACSGDGN